MSRTQAPALACWIAPSVVLPAQGERFAARSARSDKIYREADDGLDEAAAKALIDEIQPKLDELRREKEPLRRELDRRRPSPQRPRSHGSTKT